MPAETATPEHEKLYEDALAVINLLFSDNSVTEKVTQDSLHELRGEIDTMLDALGSPEEDLSTGGETVQEILDDDEPED